MKLERRFVEKPWGRTELPVMFGAPRGKRIGEVWFTGEGELPLLAKYIFTSEKLSVQVHPDDEQARARGLPQGKSECWYILDADPGATLGLGLTRPLSKDELRTAALDGSIERMMDWRAVKADDFVFVPSGTIHAIGGGIALLEFQQNSDVTYRLYDYGRPRELHLEDGVAVANRTPFRDDLVQHVSGSKSRTVVDGPHFTLVLSDCDALQGRRRWVLPLEGRVRAGDDVAEPGDCLLVDPGQSIDASGAWMLIGATAERS